MSDRQKAFLAIILGALLGGATSAVSKIGLNEFPPLSFAFVRFLIASILILPFFISKKKDVLKDFLSLVPLSLLGTINIAFFILGLKITTATISQLLYAAVPLLTGLIMYFFIKEKLHIKKIAGIIIGFVGVGIVVLLPVLDKGKVFSGNLTGNLLIGIGVIFWSFYMAFSKKAQIKHTPLTVTSAFIFVTMIGLFPLFIIEQKSNFDWWNDLTMSGVMSILYIAIISTVVTYLLNQYAIKHGGSVFASMALYIQPIFAFLSAFVLLGERLTLGLLIGGTLALLGVFFVTKK